MYTRTTGAHNPQPASQPVYLGGRVVGYVVRGGAFYKTVCASKHFLRQPKAICFDRCTLHDAEAAGALRVEVRDQETGRVYSAPLETMWAHCFAVHRGFGDQVGLGLDYWRINGAPAVAEQRAAASNQEVKALQLGLFGGAA